MERRMLITMPRRIQIVKQAIKEKSFAGMYCMDLAHKSAKKLMKQGIKLKDDQELRSLVTEFNGRQFIMFLIDKLTSGSCWALWELEHVKSKYGHQYYTKETWRGYIDSEWI